MRRAAGALVLAALALAPAALAQPAAPRQILVRIEGYIGPKPQARNLLASWRINRNRDVYDLHLTDLLVLIGQVRPGDIIDALRPYSPALTLSGNPRALQAFIGAPAQQKMAITAYLRFESPNREMVLTAVEPLGPPPPSATPETPAPDAPTPVPT